MSLFFIKDLEEVQKLNMQLQNLWTFDIMPYVYNSNPPVNGIISPVKITSPNDMNNGMRFRIQSINLPRFKLETERLPNGQIYYSGFSFEEAVTITIYETADMASYQYFTDWMDIIFDRKSMRFRVIDKFNETQAFRKGVLTLYNFSANWSIIAGTLFNSTIRNVVEPNLRSKISIPTTSNPLAQNFINTAFSGASVIANQTGAELANEILPQVEKKTSGNFIFENMRIVNIENNNFTYEDGNPLMLSITLETERVSFEKGNNLSVN